MSDRTHGYDALAAEYAAARSATGAVQVRRWASSLPAGAEVLEVGCGTGTPVTAALIASGCQVWAVDASPRMLARFSQRFPQVPTACEPVESMTHFGRCFTGVIAWGVMFLLEADAQRAAIARMAGALRPGGELIFTAPAQVCDWQDVLTGRNSRSLGAAEYRRLLEQHGLALVQEFDDEGENHYYLGIGPR